MLIVEVVLFLILLSFVIQGARHGLLVVLGDLVGLIAGFLIARTWYIWLADRFIWLLPGRTGLVRAIAFVLIWVLVHALIGWGARALSRLISWMPLSGIVGTVLGAIAGLVQGAFFIGISVYLVMRFRIDPALMTWLGSSRIARWSEQIFHRVLGSLL